MRPVVLRHPVLRRSLGEVPLLPLPALPPDLQDLQEAEVLEVITWRFHGCVVANESSGEEGGGGVGGLLSTTVALASLPAMLCFYTTFTPGSTRGAVVKQEGCFTFGFVGQVQGLNKRT